MALINSLNTGISGLRAQQRKVEITGNNIANVSTTAFKQGRALFHTLFNQTISHGSAPSGNLGGIDPMQFGVGVKLSDTSRLWTQGALNATGLKTDIAIDGDGFFVMKDEAGNDVYSRDGSFTLNPSSYLHNPSNGYIVQGYGIDSDFNVRTGAPLENIRIPIGLLTIARQTENAILEGNLDSSGAVATNATRLNSETLYDSTTAGSQPVTPSNPLGMSYATNSTDLSNLVRYVDGTSTVIFPSLAQGDDVSLSLQKGLRSLPGSSFTYGDPPPTGGQTLGELVSHLQSTAGINTGTWDGVEQTEDTYSFIRRNSTTGEAVNGTISYGTGGGADDVATLTTITDYQADFSDVQVGDYIVFTSGGASGQAGEIIAVDAVNNTLTIRNDGFNSLETAPAFGDTYTIHAPAGVSVVDGAIQIAGNVGSMNDISNVELIHDSSRVVLFNSPPQESAEGESLVTTMTVYDSLGQPHEVDVTFVFKSSTTNGPNVFSWTAESTDDTDLDRVVGSGTLLFDSDGQYLGIGRNSTDVSLDIAATSSSSGGVTTPFNFDVDFSRLTQFGGQSAEVVLTDQDGFSSGTLQDFAVNTDGKIVGIFSNGLTRDLGQVVLARFPNNNGLVHIGENNFEQGVNSGIPVVGEPGSSARGIVRSGYLEESNVDLSEQFTDLIVGQRAFQANARTITVSDQMLQELVNLI